MSSTRSTFYQYLILHSHWSNKPCRSRPAMFMRNSHSPLGKSSGDAKGVVLQTNFRVYCKIILRLYKWRTCVCVSVYNTEILCTFSIKLNVSDVCYHVWNCHSPAALYRFTLCVCVIGKNIHLLLQVRLFVSIIINII